MDSSSTVSEVVYEIFNQIKANNLHSNLYLIEHAIDLDKNNVNALVDLGVACAQNQRIDDSLIIFQELSKVIVDIRVFYNLGLIFSLKKEYRLALFNFDTALKISPDDFGCLVNIGATYNDLKDFNNALKYLNQAINHNSEIAEVWSNKGIALNGVGQFENALFAYDRAISLNPNLPEAFYNKGIALHKLGRQADALHHFNHALLIHPNYAEAWLNKGNILFEKMQYKAALSHFEKAISIQSNFAEAWLSKGNILFDLGDYPNALTCYETVLNINPSFNWAFGLVFHTKMKMCNWSNFHNNLNLLICEVENDHQVVMPFALLSLVDDPKLHKKCSALYSSELYPSKNLFSEVSVITSKKIRIGYFSSDFHNHAVSYLIAEIFELHDRDQFEIIGFSYGAQIIDEMYYRVRSSFDHFYNVHNYSDSDIAFLARSLGIHIAVDLNGYTQNARPGIFSYRAAPIQVNFLGYPSTMGTSYHDYILADEIIIPQQFRSFYSEQIICLPNSYQPNDSKRWISSKIFTKSDFGLPDNSFVFCCFNNNYKILPEIFCTWMNILQAVENSVLWLFKDNPYAANNLLQEARNYGVHNDRIIFASYLPNEEHISRLCLADLFLDTFPYNAHTTASDALYAGLPILTLKGNSFSSRVAASLLSAVGLPHFISESLEDYERKAIDLAKNKKILCQAKDKLLNNRNELKLFDSIGYARDLEVVFKNMLARYQPGTKV